MERSDRDGFSPSESLSFVFGKTSPNSGILTSRQGPLEALLTDLTGSTHPLSGLYLIECRPSVAYRKEEIRVAYVPASSFMPPVRLGRSVRFEIEKDLFHVFPMTQVAGSSAGGKNIRDLATPQYCFASFLTRREIT